MEKSHPTAKVARAWRADRFPTTMLMCVRQAGLQLQQLCQLPPSVMPACALGPVWTSSTFTTVPGFLTSLVATQPRWQYPPALPRAQGLWHTSLRSQQHVCAWSKQQGQPSHREVWSDVLVWACWRPAQVLSQQDPPAH